MSQSNDIQYLHPAPRYSDAAVHSGVIYLAGQVPTDAHAGIADQTRQVLACIEALLLEAGSSRGHILMAQVILKDITDVQAMNEVWEAWFKDVTAPPRATFQAELVNPDWLIEVVVTAAV
jgi:enamine deaminase RidA (YjgF/YER057c/UK114 family)